MTHCYILASMSSVLQHQLKDYLSVIDMILSLKDMFGEQWRLDMQIDMRELMNTKMAKGTSVRYYFWKYLIIYTFWRSLMVRLMLNLKLILSLSCNLNSFNQFKLNCSMNKINFIFFKLLNALQEAKGIIKGHPWRDRIPVAEAYFLSFLLFLTLILCNCTTLI